MTSESDVKAMIEAFEIRLDIKARTHTCAAADGADLLAGRALPAFARFIAEHPVRCKKPLAERYCDAAGSMDWRETPCGVCDPCRLNALARRIADEPI